MLRRGYIRDVNGPVRRRLLPALACLCTISTAAPGWALAQAPTAEDGADSTIRIVPGPTYRGHSSTRWFLGRGHRNLWSDTVSVQVLDLETFGGGVSPACSPPSLLTNDLLFESTTADGYLFRSLDKPVAARYLPPPLQHSVAGNLVQGVISADHPASQIVVPPIYQAVDIPYPDATIIALPDHELGEFAETFGGMPGTLSPAIVPGSEAIPGLGPVLEIITTQELWERVRHPDDVIDARRYLTSRLVDVLVGAWGVDYNRLRWGRTAGRAPRVWRPIPWDRDHAFSVFDGFSRWYARFYLPQLVTFEADYPNIYGLTRMASPLDRRFLAGLELAAWDSVVTEIQTRVTDSLIDEAARRMPPEMYSQNGAELARDLKARRDGLNEAAEKFYRLLAEWAEVHATGERDWADVERLSDDRLRIRLWRVDSPDNGHSQEPYFSRTFRRDETKEIRLFLDGERDSVSIRGDGKQGITLRIVGGPGNDVISPPSNPDTELYDFDDAPKEDDVTTIFQPRFGGHLTYHRTPAAVARACTPAPPAPPHELKSPKRDWGSVFLPIPAFGYVSGLGIYAGLGISKTVYGFRQYPFKAQHALWGGWASTPNSFFAEYYSDFRNVVGPVGGFLGASASGVANPEFYGLGNETTSDQPNDFYKIEQFEGLVTPLATLNPRPFTQLGLGAYLRHSNTQTGSGNIIDSLQPFGAGTVTDWGGTGWFRFDSYNDNIATPSGIQVIAEVAAGAVSGDSLFATLAADVLAFTSTDKLPGHPTLAMRLGAQVNVGSYPFYTAAFLGGTDNLKGYAPNRFGGDRSIYLNTELRVFLTTLTWPIPANFGVLGITDVGRVFLTGEDSKKWHTGFGGGIWMGLLKSGQGLSLALVDGEDLRLYISTGFILKKKRVR